jgi:hypothetical protein
MRVAGGVRELADEVEPCLEIQRRSVLNKVMIQPPGLFLLKDNKRGPILVRLQLFSAKDARMLHPRSGLEFTLRCGAYRVAYFFVGFVFIQIYPDPPITPGHLVTGAMVRPGGACFVRFSLKFPRPDLQPLPGFADASSREQPDEFLIALSVGP